MVTQTLDAAEQSLSAVTTQQIAHLLFKDPQHLLATLVAELYRLMRAALLDPEQARKTLQLGASRSLARIGEAEQLGQVVLGLRPFPALPVAGL